MTATKHGPHGSTSLGERPRADEEIPGADAVVENSPSSAPSRRTRNALVAGAVGLGLVAGGGIWLSLPHGASDPRLPAGFPSSQDVPVVEGEVTASTLVGGQWQVDVAVEDHDAQLVALEELQDAGFALKGQQGSGPIGTVSALSSENYSARVEFGQDTDGNFTVGYVVSESNGAQQGEGKTQ